MCRFKTLTYQLFSLQRTVLVQIEHLGGQKPGPGFDSISPACNYELKLTILNNPNTKNLKYQQWP